MSPAEGAAAEAAGEGGSVKFIIPWPAAVHGTLVLWLLPLARPPPPPLPPLLSVPWAVSGSSRFAIYMTLGALPFPSAAAATLPRLYGHKGSSLERRTTGRNGTGVPAPVILALVISHFHTPPTHTHTPNDSVADDSLLSFHLSTRSFIHSPLQDITPEPPVLPPPPFIPPTTLPVAEDVIGPYEGVALM